MALTHGYAKDHRPDVKQVVLELMVSQDGGVPFLSQSWDGNASDTVVFKERGEALIAQFEASETPRYLMADAKLSTEAKAPTWAQACVRTCCVTFKVSGIRVIKGSRAKLEAFASVYNLASAIKYRGGSLALNCAIRASQRALNTTVSDALPSQLWLRNGTPPSWDTINSNTACFKSGR